MRFTFLLLSCFVISFFALNSTPAANAATRLVLFEEATQWNCPPCAQLNPVFEEFLKQNASKAICIRYHGWWPGQDNDPMYHFNTGDHKGRIDYYSIGSKGEPCTEVDGKYEHVGYSSSFISTFGSEMNTRLSTPTPLTLSVVQAPNGGTSTVTVTATSTSAISGAKLRVALVQAVVSDVSGGTNGETEWENVMRKMLPDYNGTDVNLSANTPKTYTFTYNLSDIPDPANSFICVWVQNDATHEVINAATDANSVDVASTGSAFKVGAPNSVASFTATMHNVTTASVDVALSLDPGMLPNGWTVGYSINGTDYSDVATVPVAAGATVTATVKVTMTDGGGACQPKMTIAPAGSHTSTSGATLKYAAISNDVTVAIIDADGDKQREAVYEAGLQDASTKFGTISTDFGADLLANDPAVKTIIYVAGQNLPTDNEFGALSTFLTNGGKLFMTGEVIPTQCSFSSPTGTAFLSSKLYTQLVKETGAWRGFAGVNDPSGIGAGISTGVLNNTVPNALRYWPDAIRSTNAKASVFAKYTGVDTACAVAVTGTGYKAVFMTFPLEGMDDQSKQSLIFTRIMNWLNAGAQATIGITAPTATTQWEQGSVQQITWSAASVNKVTISYSLDGTSYNSIIDSTDASKGFLNWTLPSLSNTVTTAYVKVAEVKQTGAVSKIVGPFTITAGPSGVKDVVATNFTVEQNYPNPFQYSTDFSFTLASSQNVSLNVYDTKGALVATVLNEMRPSGLNHVSFDALSLPAGTYEYRMTTATGTVSKMMTLNK